MIGYCNEEKETQDTFIKDPDGRIWLRSGDMGRIGDNGLVYFECRIKRMIITNGYNVYPNVIEDVIRACPGVSDCAVIGIPDALRGEIVKAYIVFDKENTAEDGVEQALKKVKEELSLSVSRFAMPRSFELVESIPKTKVGKIDIAALTNNN